MACGGGQANKPPMAICGDKTQIIQGCKLMASTTRSGTCTLSGCNIPRLSLCKADSCPPKFRGMDPPTPKCYTRTTFRRSLCPPPCCPDPCIKISPKCTTPEPCCPEPCCKKMVMVVNPPLCPPRCCPPQPCCPPGDPCGQVGRKRSADVEPCAMTCPIPNMIVRPLFHNCCPRPPSPKASELCPFKPCNTAPPSTIILKACKRDICSSPCSPPPEVCIPCLIPDDPIDRRREELRNKMESLQTKISKAFKSPCCDLARLKNLNTCPSGSSAQNKMCFVSVKPSPPVACYPPNNTCASKTCCPEIAPKQSIFTNLKIRSCGGP